MPRELEDIKYTLQMQSRYRRIKIKIDRKGNITVISGQTIPHHYIESFLKSKVDWIRKCRQKIIDKYSLNPERLEKIPQSDFIKIVDNTVSINRKKIQKIAKPVLFSMLESIAKTTGIEYKIGKLSIASSIWGSCSYDNRINLNARLMILPVKLQEYVMMHELAHVKYKHHKREFWDYLSDLREDAIAQDKELQKWAFILNIPVI